jgi:thiamine biosynthesis lipoprotein
MASRCEVRLHAPDAGTAAAWAEAAIAEVRRIEAKYSRYRDDSVTTAINRGAGRAAVSVDDETAHLIDFGAALHAQSKGRFDLTSGVLRRVWDFKAQRVPSQSAIDALLPLIGWSQVRWYHRSIELPHAGMEIDFGGIGKEYAADRAGTALVEHGARHGFVNLGGDVRVIGPAPDGTPWRIAIQHPRGAAGEMLAHLDVASGALATSGDYERYLVVDGRRYCHIMDPRTGWPVAAWQSVSVVAPLAVAAGACATIAMLHDVESGLEFLNAQGVRYLAVDATGRRHAS